VLDPANTATASDIWADSSYRSAEIETALAARNMTSHIHRRGNRNKPLTKRQEAANKTRSKVCARVEHVFGNQHNSIGGKFIRTIGLLRATARIGLANLAYNMRRLVVLERCAMRPDQPTNGPEIKGQTAN
jgi:IS5 family transposase